MQHMHKTYSTVTSSSITQSTKNTSVAILFGAFYLVTIKMIIECGSVICVICHLVILQDRIISLPFSDDIDLRTAPAEVRE